MVHSAGLPSFPFPGVNLCWLSKAVAEVGVFCGASQCSNYYSGYWLMLDRRNGLLGQINLEGYWDAFARAFSSEHHDSHKKGPLGCHFPQTWSTSNITDSPTLHHTFLFGSCAFKKKSLLILHPLGCCLGRWSNLVGCVQICINFVALPLGNLIKQLWMNMLLIKTNEFLLNFGPVVCEWMSKDNQFMYLILVFTLSWAVCITVCYVCFS
jgi:hypothetical protein